MSYNLTYRLQSPPASVRIQWGGGEGVEVGRQLGSQLQDEEEMELLRALKCFSEDQVASYLLGEWLPWYARLSLRGWGAHLRREEEGLE